jgi:lipid A 3-O-deacylase
MKKFLTILLLLPAFLWGKPCSPPLLSLGGGYWMAGKRHSGGLIQAEYKWGCKWFRFLRPQACLVVPEFCAFFVGAGVGVELYVTDHLVFSPHFSPGLYYGGKGKNLGCPLEFRSGVDLAYEFNNEMRLGTQFWHISNASIGCRNPGANAWTLYIGIPLKFCY